MQTTKPNTDMKLLRLCANQIRLNRPLPWGVRNEPGQLLLNKGFVITDEHQIEMLLERGVYVDFEEFEQQRLREQDEKLRVFDPFSVWADIQRRANSLLRRYREHAEFAGDVAQLGRQIREASEHDIDIGKFEMVQAEAPNYAVTHSLQTAVVASLVAQRLGWSDDERAKAVSAALTMNIAMLDLQNVLSSQVTPVTPAQRADIESHSHRGRTLLEEMKVSCPDWLHAVEHHHVTVNGRGFPADRTSLGELSCLIHYIDVYLAKLSPRASRPAMAPHIAAREMFLAAGGADNPYASAIIKEMGIYPPGSFVKLANGETAVVVRAGETANAPHVASLCNSEGMVLMTPQWRDTARPEYKVMSTVPRANVMVRLNRPALFGYDR